MKDRSRVIDRLLFEADKSRISLPWERGPRRGSFILRRRADDAARRALASERGTRRSATGA